MADAPEDDVWVGQHCVKKKKYLGHGTYGTVWQTIGEGEQLYALKVQMFERNDQRLEMAQREATLLFYARHSNVLRYVDACTEATHSAVEFRILTEFADGRDLAGWLERSGPLAFEDAMLWFVQLCLGMEYLHYRNVVHRDLKPANLFVTTDIGERPRLLVGDLGMAKAVDPDHSIDHTKVGGTPRYAAPELRARTGRYGREVDRWSAGAILYELLHPRHEYYMEENDGMLDARDLSLDVNREVSELLERLLADDPSARPGFGDILKLHWVKPYVTEYCERVGLLDPNVDRRRALVSQLQRLGFGDFGHVRPLVWCTESDPRIERLKLITREGCREGCDILFERVETEIRLVFDHDRCEKRVQWAWVLREHFLDAAEPAVHFYQIVDRDGRKQPAWGIKLMLDTLDADALRKAMRDGWSSSIKTALLLRRIKNVVGLARFRPTEDSGDRRWARRIEFLYMSVTWKIVVTFESLETGALLLSWSGSDDDPDDGVAFTVASYDTDELAAAALSHFVRRSGRNVSAYVDLRMKKLGQQTEARLKQLYGKEAVTCSRSEGGARSPICFAVADTTGRCWLRKSGVLDGSVVIEMPDTGKKFERRVDESFPGCVKDIVLGRARGELLVQARLGCARFALAVRRRDGMRSEAGVTAAGGAGGAADAAGVGPAGAVGVAAASPRHRPTGDAMGDGSASDSARRPRPTDGVGDTSAPELLVVIERLLREDDRVQRTELVQERVYFMCEGSPNSFAVRVGHPPRDEYLVQLERGAKLPDSRLWMTPLRGFYDVSEHFVDEVMEHV